MEFNDKNKREAAYGMFLSVFGAGISYLVFGQTVSGVVSVWMMAATFICCATYAILHRQHVLRERRDASKGV